jgi:hypothetical protein
MEENMKVLNEEELINYIFVHLVRQGAVVTQADIKSILDLELEFMIEKGFAIPIDEE